MDKLLEMSIKRTEERIAALITLQGKNSIDTKNEIAVLHRLIKYKNDRKFQERLEMLRPEPYKG